MRATCFLLGMVMLAGCERAPEQPTPAPAQAARMQGGVAVDDARIVLPIVAGRPGAIYLRISNPTANDAALTGIELAGAERVELHESSVAGGTMRMAMVETIRLPAGETVALAQGGLHGMAFGLDPADASETMPLTLVLDDGERIAVDAQVATVGEVGN